MRHQFCGFHGTTCLGLKQRNSKELLNHPLIWCNESPAKCKIRTVDHFKGIV